MFNAKNNTITISCFSAYNFKELVCFVIAEHTVMYMLRDCSIRVTVELNQWSLQYGHTQGHLSSNRLL